MRIVERVLWAIIGIGVLLKLLHLPLASSLLIIGISSVAMLYWGLGWLVFPSPTRKDQNIGLTILASFALMLLLTGILYKVQVWPSASFNLLVGLTLGTLTVMMSLMLKYRKPELAAYAKNILVRCVPLMIVAALIYPISASSIMGFYHQHESPLKQELYQQLYNTEDQAEKERIWHRIDSLDHAEHRAGTAN